MEYDGKFIIMHRNPDVYEANKYGLVAGKVDKGESDIQAMLKEIQQETGYEAKQDELEFLGEYRWEHPEKIYDFVTYSIKLKEKIKVRLKRDEHQGYLWVTPEECYARNDLIHDFHKLLRDVGYVKNH